MIKLNGYEIRFQLFPNGETRLDEKEVLNRLNNNNNKITFKYENDSDFIKLMFIKKYLDTLNQSTSLLITYMPYSRMDRSENNSPFTLKFVADFINVLNFKHITIIEPHSDVTPALINNCIPYYINFNLLPFVEKEIGFDKEEDYLFFPDAGAQKRYHSLTGYNQLVGYKNRDFKTGEIISLEIVGQLYPELSNRKVLIIDDLSSYGGTFLHSGNKLKELGFGEIYLLVAHCENSIYQGKLLKDDSPINKIFTTDSILSLGTNKIKIYSLEEVMNGD